MESNGIIIFAHLFNGQRAVMLNREIQFTRVPSVDEFIFLNLTEDDLVELGITDGSGLQRPFLVESVDHVDLNAKPQYKTEIWCSYVTIATQTKLSIDQASKTIR